MAQCDLAGRFSKAVRLEWPKASFLDNSPFRPWNGPELSTAWRVDEQRPTSSTSKTDGRKMKQSRGGTRTGARQEHLCDLCHLNQNMMTYFCVFRPANALSHEMSGLLDCEGSHATIY